MSKKMSNEDLEQDLLIEYTSRFMYFYNQNKAAVIGGAVGLIVVIGLIIGFIIYSGQQEEEAQNLLGIAEEHFTNGQYELALYGNEDDFTLGFSQIAENYGRTDAGNLAKYYAAVSEYELGNPESALNYIEDFSAPRGVLGVAPISLHAIILLELEQYEDAANMFERAANWNENESTTPYNLYEAAQAYLEAGMNQEAERLVDKIIDEYSSSNVAERALRLKGMLEVQG